MIDVSKVNLTRLFADRIATQWEQLGVVAPLCRAKPDVGDGIARNVAFDIQVGGVNVDHSIPAIMQWAHYRSAFQISETEWNCAFPDGVCDETRTETVEQLFGTRILGSAASISNEIERDLMIGTGADINKNPRIVGLYGGALPLAGGTSLSNGGVSRRLDSALLQKMDDEIFRNSSKTWNVCFTSAGVAAMCLFTEAGGKKYYEGQQVQRSLHNPTGKLVLANTQGIQFKYLPGILLANEKSYVDTSLVAADRTISATRIPMYINPVARTGNSLKFLVRCTLAMCVVEPGAFATISDIDETVPDVRSFTQEQLAFVIFSTRLKAEAVKRAEKASDVFRVLRIMFERPEYASARKECENEATWVGGLPSDDSDRSSAALASTCPCGIRRSTCEYHR